MHYHFFFAIKRVSTQHFQSFTTLLSTHDCVCDHSSMTHKVAYSAGDLARYMSNNTKLQYTPVQTVRQQIYREGCWLQHCLSASHQSLVSRKSCLSGGLEQHSIWHSICAALTHELYRYRLHAKQNHTHCKLHG